MKILGKIAKASIVGACALLVSSLALTQSAQAQTTPAAPSYTVTDLGTGVTPYAISKGGEFITGTSVALHSSTNPTGAFLWSAQNGFVSIDKPAGLYSPGFWNPVGVTPSGTVVLYTFTGFAIYSGGQVTVNPTVPNAKLISGQPEQPFAVSLNANGVVTGYLESTTSPNGQAFTFQQGTYSELNCLSESVSSCVGGSTNASGITVGADYGDPNDQQDDPAGVAIWSNGTESLIPLPGGVPSNSASLAAFINDLGHVAGDFSPDGQVDSVFLFDGTQSTNLGNMSGLNSARVLGINSGDQILANVYNSGAPVQNPVYALYSGGNIYNVNQILAASSPTWTITAYNGSQTQIPLDDNGDIVVNAKGSDGKSHGLLLTAGPTLTQLTITSSATTLNINQTANLTLTGTYSDGSTADLTGEIGFDVDATGVATISGSKLLIQGPPIANSQIQNTLPITLTADAGNGVVGTLTVTVNNQVSTATAPVVTSLADLNLAGNIKGFYPGQQRQLNLIAQDGAQAELALNATWTTSDPTIATVNNGLVTVLAPGFFSVSATVGGNTVTSPALTSSIPTSTDLGTLSAGMATNAGDGINTNGLAVGGSYNAAGSLHAVAYTGTLTDLTPNLASGASMAWATNTPGNIVGEIAPDATLANDTAVLFNNDGTYTDLNTLLPSGTSAYLQAAYAINDSSTIAGIATVGGQQHGFVLSGNSFSDLGTLGGSISSAFSVNNNNEAAGYYVPAGGGYGALYFDGSQSYDLNSLVVSNTNGLTPTLASWITDSGTIVGWGQMKYGQTHGYAFNAGDIVDLGVLPNGFSSQAMSANYAGLVVGNSTVDNAGTQHAFLYDKGNLYDLNTIAPASDGSIYNQATAINSIGGILVQGTGPDGLPHVYTIQLPQ